MIQSEMNEYFTNYLSHFISEFVSFLFKVKLFFEQGFPQEELPSILSANSQMLYREFSFLFKTRNTYKVRVVLIHK